MKIVKGKKEAKEINNTAENSEMSPTTLLVHCSDSLMKESLLTFFKNYKKNLEDFLKALLTKEGPAPFPAVLVIDDKVYAESKFGDRGAVLTLTDTGVSSRNFYDVEVEQYFVIYTDSKFFLEKKTSEEESIQIATFPDLNSVVNSSKTVIADYEEYTKEQARLAKLAEPISDAVVLDEPKKEGDAR